MLDDLVIPFFSPWVIPIPRHVTVGVRRRLLDSSDLTQVFRFDEAPARILFSRDPPTGLIVNSLFYTSEPSGVGLTFDVVVTTWATDKDKLASTHPVGFGISLEDNYTLALSYRRDIDPDTKLPVVATTQPFATLETLLHFEIVTVTIDVVALKAGLSLGRLVGDKAPFTDSIEALVDLFVTMPPSGAKGIVELKSLDGEPVKFILEGIGWRFGALQFNGVQMPDGVSLVFAGRFAIIIQEMGLRTEQGATYLSFSGGLSLTLDSFSGGFTVRRLRGRIAGNPSAPAIKLDGFSLNLKCGETVTIEVGGYYTEETTAIMRRWELGLTGTVAFKSGGQKYALSIDFIIGHVTMTSPPEEFVYLMAQIVLRITLTITYVQLLSFRLLFARNMKPKLGPVDRDAHDLRYYQWYKANDPLTVPGERRLSSWESRNDALAIGAGFGISFAGMGTVFDFTAFALFLYGPDEKGLLIVVELRLLGNPKPIGYLAIELDFQNNRWSGILGLALTIDNFVSGAPDWLKKVGQLTGTVFFSNDPNTFAIGRLDDQRTWLGVRFDFQLNKWATLKIEFIGCLEIVDMGPQGFGLVARIEGTLQCDVVEVTLSIGLGVSLRVFTTASHDFAFVAWLEAAFRFVAFKFLHLGASANVTARVVGSKPSRGELCFEVHLETPWFVPSVTWTFDATFGSLAPPDLPTSSSPLSSAGALESPQQKNKPIHVEHFDANYADRFDPQYTSDNPRPAVRTFSVNELRAAPRPEAIRLGNFAQDVTVAPIATDATIVVDWSVPINDTLALAGAVATHAGNQHSGDLDLAYDLVALAIRRRAHPGADTAWHSVDERFALTADFSDPAGVQVSGAFSPQTIGKCWDVDVRVGGEPTPKRLLINSLTPYQFATSDPESDEKLRRQHSSWPCCPERPDSPRSHELWFVDEAVGDDLDAPRFFSASASRFDCLNPVCVRAPQLAGLDVDDIVAAAASVKPGVVARATFDQDVAYCNITLAGAGSIGELRLFARDALGSIVGTVSIPIAAAGTFRTIRLGGSAPIRSLEVCYVAPSPWTQPHTFVPPPPLATVEIQTAAYFALSDYLDWVAASSCDDENNEFRAAYEGKGKLFLLPNHEYEIALTTRVTITHPSTPATSANVIEHLYFRTKGLPGLNAVQRIGDEIEPYVRSTYTGGRGSLYREEPVVLAFTEGLSIAVPLSLRPTGSAAEHTTLLRMQLVVRPDTATTPETPFTSTSTDWIVNNRAVGAPTDGPTWLALSSAGTTTGSGMISTDPVRARLAQLTQSPLSWCSLADPRAVIGTALVAPPQGSLDPDDPTRQLWPAALAHTATVLVEGAAFVERIAFDPADISALDCAVDTGSGDADAWSVSGGALLAATGTARRYAIFGASTWNHFRLSVRIHLDGVAGTAVGVALALPDGVTPSDGLFALIAVSPNNRRLILARRVGGAALEELNGVELPKPTDPTEQVTLQIWAFDDTVRATIGKLTVEAERGALREGRVALVAQGPASFADLRVQGLELYTFPFVTSRFRSFYDHVHSWSGKLAQLAPNLLGPGTTTSTTAALWAGMQSEISTAMQPTRWTRPATRCFRAGCGSWACPCATR